MNLVPAKRAYFAITPLSSTNEYMGFGMGIACNIEFFAAYLWIDLGFVRFWIGPHWVDPDKRNYLICV